MSKKVAISFSGGVDSSVAVHILRENGFEPVAVFHNHLGDESQIKTAEAVAEKLKIKLICFDERESFEKQVYKNFLKEIKNGKTPNPCVFCNRNFKFNDFMNKVFKELDIDYFATGHYAKIVEGEGGKRILKIPKDKENDQTYFLHQLSQKQLKRTIFPLENLKKSEVREIAKNLGLPNSETKSSSDICFLHDKKFEDFLNANFPKNPGNIVCFDSGKVLGEHRGFNFYTIGQRKNLRIGGVKNYPDKPFFVVSKNFEKNILLVSQNERNLYSKVIRIGNFTSLPNNFFHIKNLKAKIRFRGELENCEVAKCNENEILVRFKTPISSPATGQFCVFYDEKNCLGGGEIL
jgi:tRNA-specific 2-thiouridylase